MSHYDEVILGTTGLVSFWKCNEASGTTLADSGTGGNTLPLSGTFKLGEGGIGDGESSVGGTAVTAKLLETKQTISGSVSCECWYYPETSAGGGELFWSGHGIIVRSGVVSGHFSVLLRDAEAKELMTEEAQIAFPTGFEKKWHHIVLTAAAGAWKLYYDGTVIGSGSYTGTVAVWATKTQIEYPFSIKGRYAKAAAYSVALTEAQVKEHFEAALLTLSGAINAEAGATGSLLVSQVIQGSALAAAEAVGTLSLTQVLEGAIDAEAGVAGSLAANIIRPQTLTPAVSPTVLNPFSYYAYDLLTGRFLGQVPLRSVSFGQQLNAAGQLTATIDLRDPRVQATSPLACTIPNRTLIAVDYNGTLVWGGIVLPRSWDVDATPQSADGLLTIQCSEVWSYFAKRNQATDYSAPPYSGITGTAGMSLWTQTPWDASLIACQVIEDAIGYTNHAAMPYGDLLGGLGILLNGMTPSGSKPVMPAESWVAINYPYTSAQSVEAIVSQLSQLGLGVGFDFGVDIAYSAGPASSPIATINVNYPRRGRTVEENHLLIDLTTARKYKFPEAGDETANQVYEIGGSGAIVVDENIYPLEQGYPLWERTVSRAQIQSQKITSILGQIGVSDLAMYSYAPVTPSCTLSAFDPNLPLGSFIVGDDVQIVLPDRAPDGQAYDARFPAGLDQEWRITAWKANVTDEGDATIDYTFSQPPYLQAFAPAV